MAGQQIQKAKPRSEGTISDSKKAQDNPKSGKALSPKKSKQKIPATAFSLFNELPTELQLLIWSFAASACIFKLGWERDAPVPAHNHVLRAAPSMLRACQTSRRIILDGMVGGNDRSSSKMFTFVDVHGSRPPEHFYLSTKLDTLWIPSDFLYHGLFDGHFTVDLSPNLRHLTTERHYIYDLDHQFPTLIHNAFPNLDTLTILITHPNMFLSSHDQQDESSTRYQNFASSLRPEVDGEINLGFEGADPFWQIIVEFERATILGYFEDMKTKHKSRKVPALKFRDQSQFLHGQVVENDSSAPQV
ncbi:hypothetical protein EG329_008787 [Mollisiaceae sp. DMI_Dod_QoI]|nr:hypothetical protein EG329_008787 [Helotiales sp. DMI_Dod_QoI]